MKTFASYSIVRKMRGSFLVLGPLISKHYKSKCSLPGGCNLGARPVNYHLTALKKLGMSYILKNGYILAKSKGKLEGTVIRFPKISVGATMIIRSYFARKKGKNFHSGDHPIVGMQGGGTCDPGRAGPGEWRP